MFDTDPDPAQTPESAPVATRGGQLSDQELIEQVSTQAAHIAAAECRYVLLVAELDRRDLWADGGHCRSCAHWLNWRCGTSLATAREQVRVGRALASLPLVRCAFASGEISYSKARAITRVATPRIEKMLVDLARCATASQLELIVRSYRRVDAEEGKTALANYRRRYVRSYTDDDGMVVIQARLSPEDGAVVLGAIEAAREALRADRERELKQQSEPATPPPTPEAPATENIPAVENVSAETFTEDPEEKPCEVPEHAQSAGSGVSAETSLDERDVNDSVRGIPLPEGSGPLTLVGEGPGDEWELATADALVEACRSVLENGLRSGGDKPHVNVLLHVDERVLEDPGAEGCSSIEGIGAVSSHTARRLACDAGISPLIYRMDGRVEAEGKTRSIPRQMRRAVLARDEGCRWPGCTKRRFVDVHHVVFWSNGGRTTPSNLVSICRFHHRLVHEGGYRLETRDSGQVRVWRPDGTEVPAVAPRMRASGADLEEQHRQAGLAIDGETMPRGYAEPFDLDMTIDGLMQESGRPTWSVGPGYRAPDVDWMWSTDPSQRTRGASGRRESAL
jgi:hypothetical protein